MTRKYCVILMNLLKSISLFLKCKFVKQNFFTSKYPRDRWRCSNFQKKSTALNNNSAPARVCFLIVSKKKINKYYFNRFLRDVSTRSRSCNFESRTAKQLQKNNFCFLTTLWKYGVFFFKNMASFFVSHFAVVVTSHEHEYRKVTLLKRNSRKCR